jgi:hypothetical protein
MLLPPETANRLTGYRFFNAAVFLGLPDDYLALYRVFRDARFSPGFVLIGVDPEGLSPAADVAPDFLASYPLRSHLGSYIPPARHYLNLYAESFRVGSLMDVFASLRIAVRPLEPLNDFHSDGSLTYDKWDRQIREGSYDRPGALQTSMEKFIEGARGFVSLSDTRIRYLEMLLSEASAAGARVIIWFPPMHPELSRRLRELPRAATTELHARNVVRTMAGRYGATLCDLSDPASFGGTPAEWYDAVHVSRNDAIRMLERLLAVTSIPD